jgi:hypothetical protein
VGPAGGGGVPGAPAAPAAAVVVLGSTMVPTEPAVMLPDAVAAPAPAAPDDTPAPAPVCPGCRLSNASACASVCARAIMPCERSMPMMGRAWWRARDKMGSS